MLPPSRLCSLPHAYAPSLTPMLPPAGGTCTSMLGYYTCILPTTTKAAMITTTTKITVGCLQNPCLHGTCITVIVPTDYSKKLPASFYCDCSQGWFGTYCENSYKTTSTKTTTTTRTTTTTTTVDTSNMSGIYKCVHGLTRVYGLTRGSVFSNIILSWEKIVQIPSPWNETSIIYIYI